MLRSPVFALARPTRRRGAFAAFADPKLTAAQAYPVWLPETAGASFCITAEQIDAISTGRPGLRIPALPNVEHILLDTLGRQHVILSAGGVTLQLTITGVQTTIAPVAFSFLVRDIDELAVVSRRLSKMEGLVSPSRSLGKAPPRWTARTRKLRDALIALDGRRAGASNRQIAAVIYGHDWVEQDWPNAGLQDRLRRDLQRGLALLDGGYRDLLA